MKGELLHIVGVAIGGIRDAAGDRFRDGFSGGVEAGYDKGHPIFPGDALKVKQVAEAVEGRTRRLENRVHHVLVAAEESVRHLGVMLPDGAQQFLERETVFKEADLLEFVDADDDSHFVLKRNSLRQIKDVFRSLRQVFDAEPQEKLILGVVPKRNFWSRSREKLTGCPKPVVGFTSGGFDDGCGVSRQEVRWAAAPENIERRNAQ